MSLNRVNDIKKDEGGDIYCTSPSFQALMYEQDQTKCDYNTFLDKCELIFDSAPVHYDKKHRPIEFPTYESQRNRKVCSQELCFGGSADAFQEGALSRDFLALMDFGTFALKRSCQPVCPQGRLSVPGHEVSPGDFGSRVLQRSLAIEGPVPDYGAGRKDQAPDCRRRAAVPGPYPLHRSPGRCFEASSLSENKENLPQKQKTLHRPDDNFEIHIKDIVLGIDRRTTCMIKNIPNKYSLRMLIDLLNEDHMGTYNFLYLRMDFKNRCNVGYAFVNFASSSSVISFYKKVHGRTWKRFTSNKICELTYASIQGFERLVNKFRNSSIMQEKDSFRPKAFYTRGWRKGLERKLF